MKEKKRKRPELKIRKSLPKKAGGPITTKKGKKGYDRQRDKTVQEEERKEVKGQGAKL